MDIQAILDALQPSSTRGGGYSMQQIAEAMGCSLSCARQRMGQLVRLGLARLLPRAQWAVEPDLMGRMQARASYEFVGLN